MTDVCFCPDCIIYPPLVVARPGSRVRSIENIYLNSGHNENKQAILVSTKVSCNVCRYDTTRSRFREIPLTALTITVAGFVGHSYLVHTLNTDNRTVEDGVDIEIMFKTRHSEGDKQLPVSWSSLHSSYILNVQASCCWLGRRGRCS